MTNHGGEGLVVDKRKPRKEWASYEEASAWAQSEGLTSDPQWQERCKQGLPSNIPSHPARIYSEEFKIGGLGRFLGTNRRASFDYQFVSYEDASTWAQGEGITNQSQWEARRKQGLPKNIPSNPWRSYDSFYDLGGLNSFLGLKKFSGASKIERCLRHVLEHAFGEPSLSLAQPRAVGASGQAWKVDILLPRARLIVEYDGSRYHRNKEELDRRKTTDLLAAGYMVVRVRGSGGHSLALLRDKWDVAVQENRQDIKDQIAGVLTHLIDLAKIGRLRLAADVRWRLVSWRDIELTTINFRDVLARYDGFLPYKDASAWAQSEGITSDSQWRERCKQGLPSNIPSCPWRVYPEEYKVGGCGRFLGTNRVSTRNRQWASYEEASALAQSEGITTQYQWNERSKQGLPSNIPSAPSRIYPEEFKIGGWRRFLKTGPYAPQTMEPSPREEHSTVNRRRQKPN